MLNIESLLLQREEVLWFRGQVPHHGDKERCYGCEKMIIWCTCHMCFGELLVDHVSLIRSQALNPTYIQKKTSYVAMKQVLIVWTYQIKKTAFVRCKGFSFKTPTTGWTKSTVDLWKLKLFLFRSSERTVTKHTAGWWFGIICPIDQYFSRWLKPPTRQNWKVLSFCGPI